MATLRQIRMHHFNRATKAQASSAWHAKMAADGHNRKYHLRNAVMAASNLEFRSSPSTERRRIGHRSGRHHYRRIQMNVMWPGSGGTGDSGKAALAVEFNSAAACQRAAAAIRNQEKPSVAVCVQK